MTDVDKAMPYERYQRIYLSPHLDDAALSCGGRIFQERQAGLSVLVFTLMAGDAPERSTEASFVAALHTRWGLDAVPNPAAVRRAEDQEALAVLGVAGKYGEWPDCIYRRHPETGEFLYHAEEALFGPWHPTEAPLVDDLATHLARLPLGVGGRVYAPLSVGGHVDHRLVRRAAEVWGAPNAEWVYYEDYPYAEQAQALSVVLANGQQWQPELTVLTKVALNAKSRAVACYRSQISTFFSSAAEIDARLFAFAQLIGKDGRPAERYWRRV